ncbi:MAG: SDR family oxidoreductase [Candidatus Omnitrophica bacterium]|nr:SDR family oxidoreductase [Candidatus Omnitrophota bacterium]
MRKKRVVITGGAGFIGSHMCERLLAEDFSVICLDNLVTGSEDNIRRLFGTKDFRFERRDVSLPIEIAGGVDYVLHCASLASPKDYLNLPIETLKAGSLGTYNSLGLARRKKAVFLLFSTSEIYGDPLVHPQREDYWGHVNPTGLRSCYDESKRFSEALTIAYHRIHKLDTKIVRIFNTYGPRMRRNDGRVVPNFIFSALNSRPLTVYGRGRQTRSFCYIDDLVEGLLRLMFSKINDPVNLGNPHEFTIIELARKILQITGSKSKVVFRRLPADDPRQRRPDIGKAGKLLSWKPTICLREGLERTIAWFKGN